MEIRPMRERDRDSVAAIDITFLSTARARLRVDGEVVVWSSEPIPPFEKTYEHNELGAPENSLVAVNDNGALVGVASIALQDWNSRMTLQAIYVDRACRRQGIGRVLIDACLRQAAARHARHLWLETQDINCAAITFYEQLGFSIVGFDRSLYHDHPGAEVAVFMVRAARP
jgi:ribosomal protein S18 acetylase RimI-like enzyme